MKQIVIDEAQKFILYLENVDGLSWTHLMRQLSALYQTRRGSMFFGLGMSYSVNYADRYFQPYWNNYCTQHVKHEFRVSKESVVLFAAAEILAGANEEFKIGNFY